MLLEMTWTTKITNSILGDVTDVYKKIQNAVLGDAECFCILLKPLAAIREGLKGDERQKLSLSHSLSLCGWGPTSSTHLRFILLYSHLFQEILPWGWAIRWDVRGIWTIGPTKCRSLSERPPDLSVPQRVAALSLRGETISWHSAEVTIATTYTSTLEVPSPSVKN